MLLTAASALIFVEKRRLVEVLPDSVKKAWKDWEVEMLILASLILQIVLILLGNRRKYIGKMWIRVTVWSSYLLADWIATVTLGVISQNTLDLCKKEGDLKAELMSFWAPFLLLHLGGPDTITAYSLEDNELWLRHLAGLVIQIGLAFYVLIVAFPGSSLLPRISVFILVAGFVKFGERTWSLRSASTNHFRESMIKPADPGPNYAKFMEEFTLKKAEGFYVEADEVKEVQIPIDHSYPEGGGKLIAEAYDQFQTFKCLFVDLIISFQDKDCSQSYFLRLRPDEAFDVVEAELGFAFDVFYTKAPLAFTSGGCILRLVTFLSTCMALIAFVLLCDKSKHNKIDVVITYILLIVAILLEIYAVFVLLFSDWTDYWLSKHNKTRDSLISPCFQQPKKQRWSKSTAQYNLLSVCLKNKGPIRYKVLKLLGIDQFLEYHSFRKSQELSTGLKDLIFDQLKLFTRGNEADPTALCTRRGTFALKEHSTLEWTTKVELDQSILIWHVATDLCYYMDWGELTRDASPSTRQSKQISDYMLYLLVACPFMLPIGIGMIRFRDTCAEAKGFFKERLVNDKVDACKKLLQVNTEVLPAKVKGDRSKSILFDACRVAKSLQDMEKDERWNTISHVWVEMLAYAATHCRGYHHAQQLRKGGELLTHVWLLMAHLGITEQFQIYRGHARAKLIVK